jgi:mono/diheme cytochrome c family protein
MKKLTATLGMAVWLSYMLAGCAGLPNSELGKQEFESKCAACHGLSGKGDGPQATVTRPANLTVLAKNNGGVFPTQRVYEIIDGRRDVAAHGPRTMPVWGRFFQVGVPDVPDGAAGTFDYRETTVHDRIQAVIDYLVQLQEQ